VCRAELSVLGRSETARTAAGAGRPAWCLEMPDQISTASWSDPALWRAVALAGIVILLLVLLPIALGMHPLGSPSFDLTVDPAGPLPF
jgi:hypothetical protein